MVLLPYMTLQHGLAKVSNLLDMSAVDWVCKKISLESASEQLSDITIPRQQVLPSRLDACANVTTCCSWQAFEKEGKGSFRHERNAPFAFLSCLKRPLPFLSNTCHAVLAECRAGTKALKVLPYTKTVQ